MKRTFIYNVCTKENTSKLITTKAIEKGLKQGKQAIFCTEQTDIKYIDVNGYEITIGYRVNKLQKPTEFIIKNSFKKQLNHEQQKALTINND